MAAAHLVMPLVLQGRFEEALEEAAVMRRSWEDAGRPPAAWLAPAILAAALVHMFREEDDLAREWQGLVADLTHGTTEGFRRFVDMRVALHRGELERAAAFVGTVDDSNYALYVGAVLAELAVAAGLPEAESLLATAITSGKENDWAAACALRAEGRMRNDLRLLEDAAAAWDAIGARFERACTLALVPARAEAARAELAALGCQPPAV